jgi:hypothetical protein
MDVHQFPDALSESGGNAFSIPIPELAAFTIVAILAASPRPSCRPGAPRGSTSWTRCTTSDSATP